MQICLHASPEIFYSVRDKNIPSALRENADARVAPHISMMGARTLCLQPSCAPFAEAQQVTHECPIRYVGYKVGIQAIEHYPVSITLGGQIHHGGKKNRIRDGVRMSPCGMLQ